MGGGWQVLAVVSSTLCCLLAVRVSDTGSWLWNRPEKFCTCAHNSLLHPHQSALCPLPVRSVRREADRDHIAVCVHTAPVLATQWPGSWGRVVQFGSMLAGVVNHFAPNQCAGRSLPHPVHRRERLAMQRRASSLYSRSWLDRGNYQVGATEKCARL